jgi:uncharacterized protein (DUF1501 family)
MLIKRKEFLKLSSLATTSFMMPKFLKALGQSNVVPKGNKAMVIIQLSGGNDGLNTVIPIANDIYYNARPRIAIKKEKSLILTNEAGLHPSLIGFKGLYDEGNLAVLNGVGYPNPDRSHFRSMDIWHSASDSKDYVSTGWIGRYLDAQCLGCDRPTQALEIEDTLSLALKGEQAKGLVLNDPARLYNSSHERFFKDLKVDKAFVSDAPVDYLYKTMSETLSSADYILKNSKQQPSTQSYPNSALGNSLKTIASLIFSQIDTKVYYVSLGSFDTHIAQEGRHAQLLKDLDSSVAAFVKDLKLNNRFDDVLLMTFSEFGRRLKQNASNGTDHGVANNMFFVSGALKQKGVLNAMSSLTDLDNGDIKHTVDFKEVYATILKKWLQAKDVEILGKQFTYLNFL